MEDVLYDEAVRFVVDTQRATISGIQRKFRIGYNRAGRLIDSMESAGVISEWKEGGREILQQRV